MPAAWRIVKTSRAAAAFEGEGARLWGGRWNSPGTRIVYTSATLSLAILELLVHLQDDRPLPAYSSIPVRFPPEIVRSLEPADLPAGWNAYPAPAALQELGDRWVASGESAVLAVPSAVVPSESNFLLNPGHPGFATLSIGKASPLGFDPRLRPT